MLISLRSAFSLNRSSRALYASAYQSLAISNSLNVVLGPSKQARECKILYRVALWKLQRKP